MTYLELLFMPFYTGTIKGATVNTGIKEEELGWQDLQSLYLGLEIRCIGAKWLKNGDRWPQNCPTLQSGERFVVQRGMNE